MSISLFVISEVLLTVLSLWNKLIRALQHELPHYSQASQIARERDVVSYAAAMQCQSPSLASARRPLRVVRILEPDHVPANVGRMMISGRMADVCAELDRLAARETNVH